MRSLLRLLALLLLAVGVPAAAQAPARGPLVLAAASLQEALNAAADAYAATGRPRPVLAFAATSALARQVEAGAPGDLFIAADTDWMNALAAKRLLRAGTRANLAGNRLVLVAPADRPFRLKLARGAPLLAALGDGRLAMADPDAVPAGRYGRAALTGLGLWEAVSPRIVRAENVRAALALVERGEAPAGIVYATDAAATRRVVFAGIFPAGSHPSIVYPLAQLAGSTHPDAADFRAFLLSQEGRRVLARFGFLPPPRG